MNHSIELSENCHVVENNIEQKSVNSGATHPNISVITSNENNTTSLSDSNCLKLLPAASKDQHDNSIVVEGANNIAARQFTMNEIISPVIQRTSSCLKRSSCIDVSDVRMEKIQKTNIHSSAGGNNTKLAPMSNSSILKLVSNKEHHIKEHGKFIHGNYSAYYGYRNSDCPAFEDARMQYLPPELFRDRHVLDIGCNVGHVTLSVAKNYAPRMIVGIDIDGSLIAVAKKNIRHYITNVAPVLNKSCGDTGKKTSEGNIKIKNSICSDISQYTDVSVRSKTNFDEERAVIENVEKLLPVSINVLSQSAASEPILDCAQKNATTNSKSFPNNVMFQTVNYVPQTEDDVTRQLPEYDVILALSVTKWIHLNHGDAGLKRAFRRMYAQLRMGGTLILEAQEWPSYRKKKKITADIFRVYQSISFYPDQFRCYLLSDEVGFTLHKIIGVPFHPSKGFQRAIEIFIK